MEYINKNGIPITHIPPTEQIDGTQAILDLMATARYVGGSTALLIHKESLNEAFFDLKTGLAGEILQKFSNYRVKLAIVGDFNQYKSKALRDFIYECNEGNLVFFVGSVEEALEVLGK